MAEPKLQQASSDDTSGNGAQETATPPAAKKPSIIQRTMTKLKLSPGVLILMAKMACPPIIALAVEQQIEVANFFTTLGYLPAIISVLGLAIMPRAKFIQTILLNILFTCISAAVGLLILYCGVKAREHTSAPITPQEMAEAKAKSPNGVLRPAYNSSQNAVVAVWLFFNIWLVNTVRAARPQLQIPAIVYSIFANIVGIYGPGLPTMAASEAFVRKLLICFMAGFGYATFVSLLVLPITSRKVWFMQATGLIKTLQGGLKSQLAYFQTLEQEDLFNIGAPSKVEGGKKGKRSKGKGTTLTPTEASMQKIRATLIGMAELMGKLHGDIAFAKRETAWGKLDAADISELFKLLQLLALPMIGLANVGDVFHRLAVKKGWLNDMMTGEKEEDESVRYIRKHWTDTMLTMRDPLQATINEMVDGLQHVLYRLELAPNPKSKKGGKKGAADVEADAGITQAGDPKYRECLAARVSKIREMRMSAIQAILGEVKAIGEKLPKSMDPDSKEPTGISAEERKRRESIEGQLFLILYIDHLLRSVGMAIIELIDFAERKVADGTMSENRLIVPGPRRIKKWLFGLFKHADSTAEHTPDTAEEGGTLLVTNPTEFHSSKDPEHLPPTNVWEKVGNVPRVLSRFMGSTEAAFGFRVACATMSIAIIAYLQDTRDFFLDQRLVWAMIMVSIGMTVTAGSGVFGFIGRIAGTVIAMVCALIIWYIVVGHPPGVLVFLWLSIFIDTYFLISYPKFTVVVILTIVTQVLILGYELEVQKVGKRVAESNGQPAYPTSLLAPYRLACVAGGMLLAFIWTFIPYPILSRSRLRKDLGSSLYLLANFYSIVHTTCALRLRGEDERSEEVKTENSLQTLDKARRDNYSKILALLAGLRQHSKDTVFEPKFGGKFPRAQYDEIIQESQNILNNLALISYASRTFTPIQASTPHQDRPAWLNHFAALLSSLDISPQFHSVTSTLTLLSSSISNGTALPPYLTAPPAYRLAMGVRAMERAEKGKLGEEEECAPGTGVLGWDHVGEEGYEAFVVMNIATSLVVDDLQKLIEGVKGLVGEVGLEFLQMKGRPEDRAKGKVE